MREFKTDSRRNRESPATQSTRRIELYYQRGQVHVLSKKHFYLLRETCSGLPFVTNHRSSGEGAPQSTPEVALAIQGLSSPPRRLPRLCGLRRLRRRTLLLHTLNTTSVPRTTTFRSQSRCLHHLMCIVSSEIAYFICLVLCRSRYGSNNAIELKMLYNHSSEKKPSCRVGPILPDQFAFARHLCFPHPALYQIDVPFATTPLSTNL